MHRKKVIVFSSVILFIAIVSFVVYFFAVYRAESSLRSLVNSESSGKIDFRVKKVKLDIFHLRFEFNHPEIHTTDSTDAATGYYVRADRIILKVNSLLPFILGKQIILDSVVIIAPDIEIYKYKEIQHASISLPEEMSKIYKSLEKILNVVQLDYLFIGRAKISVIDRLKPGSEPLRISDLNLTINSFNADTVPEDKRFLFSERILLEVFNQDIISPDGLHGLKFKTFRLNTRNQAIKLDSCTIYGRQSDTVNDQFTVFFDSLRILKPDFNLLVKNGTIKFDSAICYNPDIYFGLQLQSTPADANFLSKFTGRQNLVEPKIKKLLGNLNIGYLSVRNANVLIETEKDHRKNSFKSQNSNFSIGEVLVSDEKDIPVRVGLFDLDIRNYTGYSPDSLYIVRFDGIRVRDNRIQLTNFSINPTRANKEIFRREIRMEAFELDEIDWTALIYENRLVAGHASLVKPEISMILPDAREKQNSAPKHNPFDILEKLHDKLKIGELFIENGSVNIEIVNGTEFALDNCYAGININKLLKSENAFRAVDALDTLSFGKGLFMNPSVQYSLKNGYFSRKANTLYLGLINEKKVDQNSVTTIQKIRLDGIDIRSASDISASKLSWKQAELSINMLTTTNKSKEEKPAATLKLTVRKVVGGPTLLYFIGDNIEASTQVNQITTDEIIFEPGHKPVINGLYIDGHSINLQQEKMQGSMGGFTIQDKQNSTIENLKIIIPVGGEMISLFVPRFDFSADINQGINGKLTASFIELHKPVITFLPRQVSAELKAEIGGGKMPLLNLAKITIDQPELNGLPASMSEKFKIDPGKMKLSFAGIYSDEEVVKIDSCSFTVSNPGITSDKISLVHVGEGKVAVNASGFVFRLASAESKASWSFNIDSFNSSGIKVDILQADTTKKSVEIRSLDFAGLKLNSKYLTDLSEFQQGNERLIVSNGNIAFENGKTRFEAFNLGINKSANSLSIDSLAFSPTIDRDAFMATKEYQSNFIQVFSGPIKFKDLDFVRLTDDTVFSVQKTTINNLHFLVYKDKRLPFQHDIEKPLLTDLLKKIKVKLLLDSVILKNSGIEYEEFNDKTKLYGKVYFTQLKGAITGVKNYDFRASDSLHFNVSARFMNATDLRVSYAQSYTDSLSGFHLRAIASSFDMRSLNPLLESFVSAEVKSGYLDTLRLSVIGRKHVAYGAMKMYYHDLNVQYLKKGNELSPSLMTKSISFFANRIVRNKKQKGIGEVYAERDPEKGFVNYWVKIFVGGVMTNTGVRSNNKQERKYEHSIKDYNVPQIPEIPVDY